MMLPRVGSLLFNALLLWRPWLMLLSITISRTAAITATLPLELPHSHQHQQQHARSNYYDPDTEAFAGLAGYTRHYYDTATAAANRQPIDDNLADLAAAAAAAPVPAPAPALAPATYANYEPRALVSTANGFVPTTSYNSRLLQQSEYDGMRHQGKIDFVINTPNYQFDGNLEEVQEQEELAQQPGIYYQSYAYQPRATGPLPSPSPASLLQRDYPIEQFSNYRHEAAGVVQTEYEELASQQRQSHNDNSPLQRTTREQQQQQQQQHQQQQQRHQRVDPQARQEDQMISERHVADLPGHLPLPPITTSVHHTPSSSKALAGLPLSKHIQITRNVPITHYEKQHVPYRQTVQLRVPRPVITAIPKPMPIRIPVSRTVAVPQLQELKIPVEKVKPVAVERPIPFVVERRVPYQVEKPVATPIYYPYPVKVPIVRTVVHKQRPILGSHAPWATHNHLLG